MKPWSLHYVTKSLLKAFDYIGIRPLLYSPTTRYENFSGFEMLLSRDFLVSLEGFLTRPTDCIPNAPPQNPPELRHELMPKMAG